MLYVVNSTAKAGYGKHEILVIFLVILDKEYHLRQIRFLKRRRKKKKNPGLIYRSRLTSSGSNEFDSTLTIRMYFHRLLFGVIFRSSEWFKKKKKREKKMYFCHFPIITTHLPELSASDWTLESAKTTDTTKAFTWAPVSTPPLHGYKWA